jgi:hypothetical protein
MQVRLPGEPYEHESDARDPLTSLTLPASTWREIERELRSRGVWWLANQLVNTGHKVFK